MCKVRRYSSGLSILLLAISTAGCNGGASDDDVGTTGTVSGGWVTIDFPNDTGTDTTYCNSERLGGEAFISPKYYHCCSGSASDTAVTVTWENLTSGASGSTDQSVDICYLFGVPLLCHHRWSATVPLNVGINVVRITAVDPAGVNGNTTFTISKPALSYSASGTLTTNENLGVGYLQTGVEVQLTGIPRMNAVPNSAGAVGRYSFSCLPSGSYTVSPISNSFNYNFSPASRDFVIADQDVSALDFTTTAYPISGTITWSISGAPASGVSVTIGDGSSSLMRFTQSNGSYSFIVPNGNYTITPSEFLCPTCSTFTPATRSVNVLDSGVSGLDFTKN